MIDSILKRIINKITVKKLNTPFDTDKNSLKKNPIPENAWFGIFIRYIFEVYPSHNRSLLGQITFSTK